jgi:hypothetical protein
VSLSTLTKKVIADQKYHRFPGLGAASPRILRAGEHIDFLSVGLTDTGRQVFGKFNSDRDYTGRESAIPQCSTNAGSKRAATICYRKVKAN